MKTKQAKKGSWVAIKIDTPLRRQIEKLANTERRSLADQAALLMEKGLSVLEQKTAPQPTPGATNV
jgi:hypothetical protein